MALADKLKISAFNCRGIKNDKLKQKELFRLFRERNYNIIILTETHTEDKDFDYIRASWGYKMYGNGYSSNARGVIVLINNNFEIKIDEKTINK